MKKGIKILGVLALIILLVLVVKYFMCKNKQEKILNTTGTKSSAQDLLNAAKPCKFFSLN